MEDSIPLLTTYDGFHRAQVEMVLLNDLVPAVREFFFGGTIEPEFPFGRLAIGFGIHPLAFREVLYRVRYLENDVARTLHPDATSSDTPAHRYGPPP